MHVNDLIIIGSSQDEIDKVISRLSKAFSVRNLGELRFFLRIQVQRGSFGLHLSQTQYLGNVLKSHDFENLRPASTPMIEHQDLQSDEGDTIPDVKAFRRIIGSLQYMVLTRPDIQYAVNRLSQFMASPKLIHWIALKPVL